MELSSDHRRFGEERTSTDAAAMRSIISIGSRFGATITLYQDLLMVFHVQELKRWPQDTWGYVVAKD